MVDPLGGINSLWPLFGIANQLLASTALALATTLLIKSARPVFAFTTIAPLTWLLSVTMTAGSQKIWDPDRRIGFLAQADYLAGQIAQGLVAPEKLAETKILIFNNRLDAALTGAFMVLVAIVVLDAARVWWNTLRPGGGTRPTRSRFRWSPGPQPAPGAARRCCARRAGSCAASRGWSRCAATFGRRSSSGRRSARAAEPLTLRDGCARYDRADQARG